MRLLSLLVLSYAAVATALTNVGFGGKRGSTKHFQGLDLELDRDSDRSGAVAIAFILGAQNLAAIPGGAPNLALARLAGWEYWLRGDGNSILACVAKYLPDRAHDIAFTKRVGSAEPIRAGSAFTRERFVTTPVAWKRVADATTIAALQVPGADGTKVDVFPSSVAVAREVGDFLARRR